jgi:hypothetical protein
VCVARHLQPKGVHVSLLIIDGQIATPKAVANKGERSIDTYLDPDAIAETVYQLTLQHKTAWTFQLDIRPFVEKF